MSEKPTVLTAGSLDTLQLENTGKVHGLFYTTTPIPLQITGSLYINVLMRYRNSDSYGAWCGDIKPLWKESPVSQELMWAVVGK